MEVPQVLYRSEQVVSVNHQAAVIRMTHPPPPITAALFMTPGHSTNERPPRHPLDDVRVPGATNGVFSSLSFTKVMRVDHITGTFSRWGRN
ncbi:hypothetical protein Pcinc_027205 [Petrolisthes cinctipes]|uniref:Uncharacterized protein n=1 Tax=Petrolisthes cinctipes TaxID=88211 RepID=A0AAE1F6H9_PETCI|nr:hypothetical protein Pcinc_027205 [Petrolisthes cinctipes]